MNKIVPIILVVCTFLSAFSIFTVQAHAIVGEAIAGGLIGLGMFAIGQLLGQIGNQAGGALADVTNNFVQQHDEYIHRNDIIKVNTTHDLNGNVAYVTFEVNGDIGLTGVELEVTQQIVDDLNNGNLTNAVGYNAITGNYQFDPTAYTLLKSSMGDMVSKAIYKQYYEEAGKNTEELSEILGNPFYKFDFVGPMPAFTTPELASPTSAYLNGFYFSSPIYSATDFNTRCLTKSQAEVLASSLPNSVVNGDEYCDVFISNVYSGGTYVIYNGKIYYFKYADYSSSRNGQCILTGYFNINSDNKDNFVASDGTVLSSVASYIPLTDYKYGVFYNYTGENHTGTPISTPSDNDFTSTSGGSVSVPRTDDENNVGLGMALGLIGNSDILELNPDGTIKSVGGIDMAKLTDLIGKIQDDDLSFENVQEYLELIAKYVSTGNLTAQEQSKILANVQSNVASIADIKIKADYKFDVKTPDTIINKFPFSLPFDVYNIFNLLSAEPKTPKFTIPLEMEGVFKEEITIDLSQFDNIAFIVRWLLYIIFILGLILVTNKLIGRG